MSKNEPAFPRPISHDAVTGEVKLHRGDHVEYANEQEGMSLRDYFAAKAMEGYCVTTYPALVKQIAEMSYEMADAMLERRAKK